jgi:hypothetical protein
MTRHALALALCIPALTFAAPAPSGRHVTAEAVIQPLGGNPREAAARLSSVPAAAKVQTVVDEKHGTITFRLVGCAGKDAISVLTAAVEAYKQQALQEQTPAYQAKCREEMLGAMQQGNGPWGGGLKCGLVKLPAADLAPLKAAIDRSVIQAPRVVRAGVFGRDSAR